MVIVVTTLLASILIAYIAICLYMLLFQDKLLYIPTSEDNGDPSKYDLAFTEHWIKTKDGESLHSWYVPAENAEYTVLFFHGNTGNITDRLETIQIFNQLGLNLLIIDYRGYGKSSGIPSEHGTYADGDASWHYLIDTLKASADKIIIFGRSLGGGIATELATRYPICGLALESTYTTLPDIAHDVYPYIPTQYIIKHEYNNLSKVPMLKLPLLVIHSTDDEYIKFEHGQELYNAAENCRVKHFVAINGSHGEGFFTSIDQYKAGIQEFLKML